MLPLPLFLVLLVLSQAAAAAAVRDPGEHFFQQTLGDFTEELALAREEGKTGILIMFEMDECPFCHRMKTTVLNRADVQDYYRDHFLVFAVDIEGDVEITDFAGRHVKQKDFAFEQFRVRATPVFAFFDLEGRLVARYTGATRDAEEFLWLGEYVVAGAYADTSFTRYKRERRERESR
jgi:thioredoxin-related protein